MFYVIQFNSICVNKAEKKYSPVNSKVLNNFLKVNAIVLRNHFYLLLSILFVSLVPTN